MIAYISATGIISPQPTFNAAGFPSVIHEAVTNRLTCIEPDYRGLINPIQLRRMPRILKMGLAASRLCLNKTGNIQPDAIIIGTGLGCLESLEKFLLEVLNTREHVTSVLPFINATHNAVAAQVAMMLKNHGYNMTYCHRAFSFESALIDALMHINEQRSGNLLVGGIDECTDDLMYLYSHLKYWKSPVNNLRLFENASKGTISGEGAAFFMISAQPSEICLEGVHTFLTPHGAKTDAIIPEIDWFLKNSSIGRDQIDVVLAGLNGDADQDNNYRILQNDYFNRKSGWAVFKHLCGEYYTASSFALWLGTLILREQSIPAVTQLSPPANKTLKYLLIYNHVQNHEHALILLSYGKV
jgi:3-oxoacyl-(acyl-carrier-protein) synthase